MTDLQKARLEYIKKCENHHIPIVGVHFEAGWKACAAALAVMPATFTTDQYLALKADCDDAYKTLIKTSRVVEAAKNLVDTSGRHSTSIAYLQLHDAVEALK